MQSRVRLLYLEFMYLLPQLKGFYSPQGAAAAPKRPTSGMAPSKPFYLRVPAEHPVCESLRSAHVTELSSHRQGKRPAGASPTHTTTTDAEAPPPLVDVSTAVNSESCVIFKLQRDSERALVAPFMPAHWDNNTARKPSPSPAGQHAPAAERAAEAEYRARVQRLFYANALVPLGSPEWKRCLARGRYEVRSVHNVLHVRKYRALHKRYSWASQLSRTELEAAWGGSMEDVEQALLGLSNRDVYGYSDSDTEGPEEAKGNGKQEEHAGRP
ncbi:conserved hypothetical protein [Leishmania mexicana MHOM/GT/2001/U1103]|uniref:Uncharacterized protein n=1 Tax=Leishmania mexicana (strain MHOM/GT/2001/U1103) TaxID=929439 RepID=E9B4L1_LEIMU|nr:conserved hypothetical protein [Leishmania mexicana MHOM/GT/2001/U1103]CBZ30180.1 conserved hypothetical protein [Leishmania mexicana MHOM/GT/2001/U1103]